MYLLRLLVFLFLAFGVYSVSAQESHSQQIVTEMLARGPRAIYTSWDEKELTHLGDSCGVILAKIYSSREPNQAEIEQILFMIDSSFAYPPAIKTESDREPKASLLFLRHLKSLTLSGKLKRELDEAEKKLAGLKKT